MDGNDRYLERWQSRVREPTSYENALADALEAAIADGIIELSELVRRLNEVNVKAPDGREWTEESFQLEMKRIGT